MLVVDSKCILNVCLLKSNNNNPDINVYIRRLGTYNGR